MVKHINMQTALCLICKETQIKKRCSTQHLLEHHNLNLKSVESIIRELEQKSKKLVKEGNQFKLSKRNREEMSSIFEDNFQPCDKKLKEFLSTSPPFC